MTKNEWLAKLHELAFEDTRLDRIPFVCFEPLAEGIAKIEAAQQSAQADRRKVHDMGEVNGVKLTYVDGNVFATPSRRGARRSPAR